jgi:hypothetical protein
MRAQDIKIGESYRHREHPEYAWAKAVEILKPGQGGNNQTFTVVKCEWTVHKNDGFGLIKYFRPRDLIEGARK